MSSEVFSTVAVDAARKLELARRTRAQIAEARRALKQMSRTVSRTAQIMQTQGKAISEELRRQGEAKSVTISRISSEGVMQSDVSGFDRNSINQLVEAIRQTEEALSVKGENADDIPQEEFEGTILGLEEEESYEIDTQNGYVKGVVAQASEAVDVMSPEERKIIEYSNLLNSATSRKEIAFTELLIVAFTMFEAPVWSEAELKVKKSMRRKVERLDGDDMIELTEKIEKLKAIIAEYSESIGEMPEDFDADSVIEEYTAVKRRLGRRDDEEIPVSQMPTEIEKMMARLLEKEEEEYIKKSIVEAFEEEGVLLDEFVSMEGKQVFYLEDEENCEVVLEEVDNGFLLESVGLSELGKDASVEEKDEMVKSAKKVCDKYKRVVERLKEKGVIVNIGFEDVPDRKYIKIAALDKETQERRHKIKTVRRRRREKKKLKTFD